MRCCIHGAPHRFIKNLARVQSRKKRGSENVPFNLPLSISPTLPSFTVAKPFPCMESPSQGLLRRAFLLLAGSPPPGFGHLFAPQVYGQSHLRQLTHGTGNDAQNAQCLLGGKCLQRRVAGSAPSSIWPRETVNKIALATQSSGCPASVYSNPCPFSTQPLPSSTSAAVPISAAS